MIEIGGLNIPTSWADISFGEYCRMYSQVTDDMTDEEKVVSVLCNLLDIDTAILSDLKKTDVDNIYKTLSFMSEPIPAVKGFESDGYWYEIPVVDTMTYRQYTDAEASVDDNSPYNIFELACCLFVQSGNTYSTKQADRLKEKIGELPCTAVVGAVLDFIEKKKNLSKSIATLKEIVAQNPSSIPIP